MHNEAAIRDDVNGRRIVDTESTNKKGLSYPNLFVTNYSSNEQTQPELIE